MWHSLRVNQGTSLSGSTRSTASFSPPLQQSMVLQLFQRVSSPEEGFRSSRGGHMKDEGVAFLLEEARPSAIKASGFDVTGAADLLWVLI